MDISDPIGQLGGQNIVDQCTEGATQLCSLIERDAEGIIFRVNNGYLNIPRRAGNLPPSKMMVASSTGMCR